MPLCEGRLWQKGPFWSGKWAYGVFVERLQWERSGSSIRGAAQGRFPRIAASYPVPHGASGGWGPRQWGCLCTKGVSSLGFARSLREAV